ncbi:polyadenylate-binding protein-interacting protein 1-like [Tachysurus fulvidraco]|uniref:polyadenylate-binding protein-interacting protein 1-like n=1 Tax=Tachysurus fulvidraco TaxID=1234273 RepID=UPI001FEE0DF9|nr:polyadenylate-binding protein-interacting protein 1-like [Tachysurus fulvidraco]
MSAQKLIKPAKLKLDPKGKVLTPNIVKKDEARETEHDYAMEVTVLNKRERGAGSRPSTPCKTPAEKRVKPTVESEKVEISNETILEAILNLEKRVDEKLADLSEQAKQSSAMIVSLTKAIQFNTEELQSTSMPNFPYTGARLCNFLSHHLALSPASGNFRQLLLKRCRTEYEQRQQALMGDEETQRKFHTYILLLGELYLNLEVKSVKGTMSRAEILLAALKDLMDTLFSQPKDRNLICAIKLLKLTGSVLEDVWKQSGKSHMDELVRKIEEILLDSQCSRDVRQMLLKLVELRSSNWGRVYAAAAHSDATPDNDPNYYMNEPTFYTADGIPFTAADPDYSEKYQILDREDYFPDFYDENGNEALYSEEEEEMEPEIEEAFEKFCLETERKKNMNL